MSVRSVASLLGRAVHVRPSRLVASLPPVPTATQTPWSKATPVMSEFATPLVRSVHETPSMLVRSVPSAPTVTQRPAPNATAARFGVPRGLALGPIVAAAVWLAPTLGLTLGLALAPPLALAPALGL